MIAYALVTLVAFVATVVFLAKDGAEPGEISAGALAVVIFWPLIVFIVLCWLLGAIAAYLLGTR